MNFKNFQARAWDDLFSRSIYDLMKSQSFVYEGIRVDYYPENASAFLKTVVDSDGTNAKALRVKISFTNEESHVETTTTLITLPTLTEDGLMINGTKWTLINTAHPASGWYLLRNKKGNLELVLQRGSMKVLTFNVPQPWSKNVYANVTVAGRTSRTSKVTSMPLFAFLKAISCDPNCTYKDLADMLDDCPNIRSAYYSEYINITKNNEKHSREASLVDSADALLHNLTGYPSDYVWDDPVETLKEKLASNSLRIGKEKKPRFKRFVSFARAKGTTLTHSVTLSNGFIIAKGETLTDSYVRILDSDESITELHVEYNDRDFCLRKYSPEDSLTLDEVLCALRVYDQALSGLALVDDPDELYNKVINSIREDYEKRIELALGKFTNAIIGQIRAYSCGTRRGAARTDDIIAQLGSFNFADKQVTLEDVYAKITKEAYYQQFDETNSLSNYDQSYKLTTTAKNVSDSARDIHSMQYGRICPYTTSESKQVGLNLALTLMSELDEYGFITTPVYKFENGVLSDRAVFISAVDELTEVTAPATTDLVKLWNEHSEDPTFIVPDCRINGQLVSAPLKDITSKYVTSLQTIGPLPAAAPAANMDSPKRLIMCASAQRQALVPLKVERPFVTTGIEGLYEIGVTTADTMIRDYLIAHGKPDTLADDACVYYVNAYKNDNKLFVNFEIVNDGAVYKVERSFDNCKSTLNGSLKYLRLAPPTRADDTGRYYKGNDVVTYNSDVDLTEASFSKDKAIFGTISLDADKLSKHGVAIGNNCKVLFKSFEGYTYEDSIEVTEAFLAKRGLSVVKTTTLRFILHKSRKEHVELLAQEHGQIPQLDATGYPIRGYYVQTGQDILATVSTDENGTVHAGTKKVGIGQSGFIIGYRQYRDANNSDNEIVAIDLGDILDVTSGDKLEGLHGNKGVVGRILRNSEVPYTEDGEVPDLVLNPLGIVARLNTGQIPEFTLGAIAEKTGEIQILEPFADITMESIAALAESCGIVEKDIYDARTGLKYPKKAMIGNMYMLRLQHTSTSKYNATSDCKGHISARTGQPQSGSGGGQRMSELCTWCVTAYGARKTLDSLFTVQSDAINAKSKLDKAIKQRESTEISYISNNIDFLQAYMHLFGAHVSVSNHNARIELLTQGAIDSLAPEKCRLHLLNNGSMTAQALLHDISVFGEESCKKTNRSKSAQLPFSEDNSCEMIMPIYLKADSVLGMFRYAFYKKGVLSDALKVPHNNFFNKIIEGKMCIVGWTPERTTDSALKTLYAQQYGIVLPDTYKLPIIADLTVTHIEQTTGKVTVESNDIVTDEALRTGTGIRAVIDLFKQYDLRASLCQKLSGKPCSAETSLLDKKEFPHVTDIVLFLRNYSLTDFIVTSIIVPPVGYRNINAADTKMSNPIDAKLNDVVNSIRMLSTATLDSDRAHRETELYKTLNRVSFESTDSSNPSLKDQLVNHKTKTSVMRDTLLSKRLSYTGRSVITIGSDLEFGECGMPICMLTTIFESHIAAEICDTSKIYMVRLIGNRVKNNSESYFKRLNEFIANDNIQGFQNYTLGRISLTHSEALAELASLYNQATGENIKLRTVKDLFDICYSQLLQILTKLLETHPVLLNREPSLHKFSVQGFQGIPIDSYAIKLHPLNCHGYNADYDGDQMASLIPMQESAIEDVRNKMMSTDNIIDPKDGSGIIAINQDMILGLYYATIHENNSLKYEPSDLCAVYTLDSSLHFTAPYGKSLGVAKKIYEDIEVGLLNVQDTIMCIYDGRHYIAEAGRFIVNAMLPGGLGFTTVKTDPILGYNCYDLAINYVLSKKTIGRVETMCIDYFSKYGLKTDPFGDSLGAAYNRLMRIGFRMADLSGVTLSIFDLTSLPVKSLIKDSLASNDESIKQYNDWYALGFCTDEDRDKQSIESWQKTTNSLKSMLKSEFTGGSSFDRMSNIFMIIDSGARGDIPQLLEMSGVIGVVTNSSGKSMTTPVRRSYSDGLTSEQFMQNSYTGRRQTTAAQLTTADAGEFTRHCIYLTEHIHIRNDSKRCDATGTWISLNYQVSLFDHDTHKPYDKEHIDDTLVLSEDEIRAIPNELWRKSELFTFSEDSVLTQYLSFVQRVKDLLISTKVSDEFKHLLSLCEQSFFISKSANGTYNFIDVEISLSSDSKSMLYYRVLDVSELEAHPETAGYAYLWRSHTASIVGSAPETLEDDIVIGDSIIHDIEVARLKSVPIFTVIGCKSTEGICQCCFGVKYDSHSFPDWGESVGYQGTQAIGNPITQMMLDSHKLEVSNEESAKVKLNRILSNNYTRVSCPNVETAATLPIAIEDTTVSVKREGNMYLVTTDGEVKQALTIKDLADLKVAPDATIKRGMPITTVATSFYNIWLGLTDSINVQLDIWNQLCNCFKNELIYARNFEIFARALTEFGCAESTDMEHGIVRNAVYRTSTLDQYGIKWVPVFLSMRQAMNKSGKILANIALSNACSNIVSSVVQGTINTPDSNVGTALLGDYHTAKCPLNTKSVLNLTHVDRSFFDDTMIVNTQAIVSERETLSSTADLISEVGEESNSIYAEIKIDSDYTTFSVSEADKDAAALEEPIRISDEMLIKQAEQMVAEEPDPTEFDKMNTNQTDYFT